MLKDQNTAIVPMARKFMINRPSDECRTMNIYGAMMLNKLRMVSNGEIKKPDEVDVSENVSDFIKSTLLKEKVDKFEKDVADAAHAATALVQDVEDIESAIDEEIKSLQAKMRKLKKDKKRLADAKEHGKATCNYLPLLALVLPLDLFDEAKIDKAFTKIPEEVKVRA